MQKDKEWLKIQIEDILYRLELSGDISTPLGNIIEQRIGKKINELEYLEKPVVTYFSPFTDLPVLVETETHKYMIEVTKIIEKEVQ